NQPAPEGDNVKNSRLSAGGVVPMQGPVIVPPAIGGDGRSRQPDCQDQNWQCGGQSTHSLDATCIGTTLCFPIRARRRFDPSHPPTIWPELTKRPDLTHKRTQPERA